MPRRWNLSPGRGKPPPWQHQPPKEPLSPEDAAARTERRAKRMATQKRATDCEDIAHNQLMARGFVQVRRIETGRTVTGKHVRAVDGDRTGNRERERGLILCCRPAIERERGQGEEVDRTERATHGDRDRGEADPVVYRSGIVCLRHGLSPK